MVEQLKNRVSLTQLLLVCIALIGLYLSIAWISYSPLDNAWSVASTLSQNTLNKTGGVGAWFTDIFLALFGKIAFLLPFSLLFVPLYVLFISKAKLTALQVIIWILGFCCLMISLATLAAFLLSNTATYLAGGVIGAILLEMGKETLGLFGSVLLAILAVSVGFYYCSGQILIQLSNQLYHWVIGHQMATQEPQQAVTSSPDFAKVTSEQKPADSVELDEKIAVPEEIALTDVSLFTRPKIIGLQKQAEETVEEIQEEASEITNSESSFFHIENHVENVQELPKITIPTLSFENEKEVTQAQTDEVAQYIGSTDFPKIRLNPETDKLQNVAPISPLVEAPQLVKAEESSAEPQPEFIKPHSKVELPEPIEPKKAVAPAKTPVVHPLLQRQKMTEKPTTPLPTLDLLAEGPKATQQVTEQQILETSARIEQELANFGVKATVEDVLVGPVVTRYEIEPAAGVKASKITNLANDLARSLIFEAIRITDVVPGKPFMGIETPNAQRQTVWLRDVFDSAEFRQTKAILPMALGKDISGKPIVVDMAKMPHLLVAGQTGGGKSVGVNTMILSLLFKLTPNDVRFIMIDPKVVELSVYNDIPHLLTPVVTDVKEAENALRWAVEEMERRYQLVSYLHVRNIEGYNSKLAQAEAMNLPIKNPYWKPSDSMDLEAPDLEKMSYIVLIVDEFADLMMSAGKQVEDHIMRIAQKARAVGIHLILATQRPSTDVITGVIKANIPSRIAFTVASQIDSRTILDKGGAEALLGRGDMLYSGAGNPEIIRIHGAFMSDEDVQRVADNWRARGKPDYIDSIIESPENVEQNEQGEGSELDPLFDEIVQYMIDGGLTSISGVQRRFSIGFNRAARIIEQLEEQGILSKPDNRGKRELLSR